MLTGDRGQQYGMTRGEVDEALKQYQELSEKQQRGETGETTDRGMLGDMILNFRLPSIMEFLTLMGSNRMVPLSSTLLDHTDTFLRPTTTALRAGRAGASAADVPPASSVQSLWLPRLPRGQVQGQGRPVQRNGAELKQQAKENKIKSASSPWLYAMHSGRTLRSTREVASPPCPSDTPKAKIRRRPSATRHKRHVLHVRSLALSLFDADLGANVAGGSRGIEHRKAGRREMAVDGVGGPHEVLDAHPPVRVSSPWLAHLLGGPILAIAAPRGLPTKDAFALASGALRMGLRGYMIGVWTEYPARRDAAM